MELNQLGHDMAIGHQYGHHDHHLTTHNELSAQQQQQQQQQGQQETMPLMMMMKMYFHFGMGDVVLFESLVINSTCKLWLTSATLFLAAILLEAIDYSRGYLSCRCSERAGNERHTSASSQSQLINNSARIRNQPDGNEQRWSCCSGSHGPLVGGHAIEGQSEATNRKVAAAAAAAQYFPIRSTDSPMIRAAQSVLHFIRTGLSLGLMLVAMTYNVCLIAPILLGSGLGFYIFYRPALDSKSVMCH